MNPPLYLKRGEKDGFSYILFSIDYIGVDTGERDITDLFSAFSGDSSDEYIEDADRPIITEYGILVDFPEAEAVLAMSSDRSEKDVRAAFKDMSFATEDVDTQ